MLSWTIKLLIIFIIFAVTMVVIIRDKKVKCGWMVLGVFLPVAVYILCEAFGAAVFPFLYNGSVLAMTVWDATEWIICSLSCVVGGIIIFKTVTKSKDNIFKVFKKNYKKWNIVIMVLIIMGAVIIIAEGIDYTIHEEEYERMIENMITSSGFLDLMSGEVMPGNMRVFAALKKISGLVMLAGIMLPSVMMARKTEMKSDNL